jgi:hypothetical protein
MIPAPIFRRAAAAILLLAVGFLPAACANEPPAPPQPQIGFEGKPFKLNVASIAVDDRYNPPGTAPYVEHLHPITPAGIAQRWADTRIVAVGRRGIATLTVLNGSVVESKLATKGGLTGFFGDQVDTKLTATMSAKLVVSITGDLPGDFVNYSSTVNATADKTILQSADLNERDRAYFDLMQLIAKKFDAALSAEVRHTMAPVIVP